MSKRKPPAQASLFCSTPQRRYVEPEPLELYDAIVRLRRKGFCVYRAGKNHIVDGTRIRTSKQVVAMARVDA